MPEKEPSSPGSALTSDGQPSPLQRKLPPPPPIAYPRHVCSRCKLQRCPYRSKLWKNTGTLEFVRKTWNNAPGSIDAKEEQLEWYELAANGKEYLTDPTVVDAEMRVR